MPEFAPAAIAGGNADPFLAYLSSAERESAVAAFPPETDAKDERDTTLPTPGKGLAETGTSRPERKEQLSDSENLVALTTQLLQIQTIPPEIASSKGAATRSIEGSSERQDAKIDTGVLELLRTSGSGLPSAPSECAGLATWRPASVDDELISGVKNAPQRAFGLTPRPEPTNESKSASNTDFKIPGTHDTRVISAAPNFAVNHACAEPTSAAVGDFGNSLQNREQPGKQIASSGELFSSAAVWMPGLPALRGFEEPDPAVSNDSGQGSITNISAQSAFAVTDSPQEISRVARAASVAVPTLGGIDKSTSVFPASTSSFPQELPISGRVGARPELLGKQTDPVVQSIESSAKTFVAKGSVMGANGTEPSQFSISHNSPVVAAELNTESRANSPQSEHRTPGDRANIHSHAANDHANDEATKTGSERSVQAPQLPAAQTTERSHEAVESGVIRLASAASPTSDASNSAAIPSTNEPGHAEPVRNLPGTELAPDLAATPVHTARIFQGEDRSEMHIGLRTENFGNVQLRTTVSGSKVDVALGSERGDLKAFLASELPALRDHLQTRILQLHDSGAHTHTAGEHSGSSAGGYANYSRRQPLAIELPPIDFEDVSETEDPVQQTTSLNVTV